MTRKETMTSDALVAAATAAVTSAVAKDMANIVNVAVANAMKEHAANIPSVAVAPTVLYRAPEEVVNEPVPQGQAVIPPVVTPTAIYRTAEEAAAAPAVPAVNAVVDDRVADGRPVIRETVGVNKDGIKEIIKYVEVEQTPDASIAGLVAMGSALVGSVGYDLLFGDENKSTLDIAIDGCTNSLISGVLAYSGATLFAPRDNSALSITAMGLTASSLIVGADKAIKHFSNNRQEALETTGSILENLTK